MAKKSTRSQGNSGKSGKISNSSKKPIQSNGNPSEVVENGLEQALFGMGAPGAFPGVPGYGSASVSQVGNIFSNLRWYFISNFRQAFCELGLVQTVCKVPVDDALHGGVFIHSKKLSPDQILQLQETMEREDDLSKIGAAGYWTRLFGGGGVIINTDQDYETPLDLNAIGPDSQLEFVAVDMWELYFDLQNAEGYDNKLQDEKFEYYSYYCKKVHKSRVLKMEGLAAPSFLRPRLRGWGFSVVEAMVRSINQYLEGTDLMYELIGEAKIDVYGIKNLTNTLLSPNGTLAVSRRIQVANQQKDYQHALVMDAEDNYTQKQLTFAGLAEVMNQVRMQLASDLRMPISKIFGIASSGFSSGEDDIEVYNTMVEGTVRRVLKKPILQVLELRCQKLFGFIPDDLKIEFKPLRVMSSVEESKTKSEAYNRITDAYSKGLMSLAEAREACNKQNLLEIELDNSNLPEGAEEIGQIQESEDHNESESDSGVTPKDKDKGKVESEPEVKEDNEDAQLKE